MSIAREPGRLRRGDGRAWRIGWTVALALLVAMVLFAVVRMATAPAPPAESSSRPSGAAATVPAAGTDVTTAPRDGQETKRSARVAQVEIQERRVPALPPRPRPPATAAKPAPAPAPRRSLPSPPLRPQARAPRPAEPPPATPPPAAAPKPEPEAVSLDLPLEPEERPEAHYPEDAAAEGVTGKVRLKVVVDPRGRVEDTLVVRSSGDGRLDRAAQEAVRRWRYRPAQRAGRTVTATDYVEVEFYRERKDISED